MRYHEFVTERRDLSKVIDNLRSMIDHPGTPPAERENAKAALAKILDKKKNAEPKTLGDELPDFGDKRRTYTKSGKFKDHLPDFGKVDIKV